MSDAWINKTHIGDCRSLMALMVADGVHANTCVTSPPYYGLRDYGTGRWDGGDDECDHLGPPFRTNWDDSNDIKNACGKCGAKRVDEQIGLESTPDEYIETMVNVFRAVRDMLTDDGTLWLNLGDSYAGQGGQSPQTGALFKGRARQRDNICMSLRGSGKGLKSKDLMGMPWAVAFALRDDGWYLRSDIIWHKPNPMPESVTDRPTKSHEHLFLMAKSERYYYDAESIRDGRRGNEDASTFRGGSYINDEPGPRQEAGNKKIKIPGGWDRGEGAHGTIHRDGRTSAEYQQVAVKEGRNKRDVWTIATEPFKAAHFATFPRALIEPCIIAGCIAGGTVLDPFMGSGTVAQVATDLGRQFIGCELNKKYVDMHEMRKTTTGMPF